MARRTKIVATIGPVSTSEEVMAAMMRAGMNVARIPLAHTSVDDGLELHQRVRAVAADKGYTVATMVDLPGPLIRTGSAPIEGVDLAVGDHVDLVEGDGIFSHDSIFIDYPNLVADVFVDERINIGESVVVEAREIGERAIRTEVVSGGSLNGRSAVKLPSRTFQRAAITDDDRAGLNRFIDAGVDIVAISARHGSDLADLQLTAPPNGPLLMAKIESMEAVENLDSLIAVASGIIIGRGGLGLEAELHDLPHIQKSVIEQCIAGGLPVVTASQMLDSMLTAPVPTRAETTDICNAIFDGTSGLMLSAETAIGDHPIGVISTMDRIAARADEQFDHAEWSRRVANLRMTTTDDETTITDAMTIGAARTAEELGLATLLCISASGFTVRSMARFRPSAQIIGASVHERTVRQLAASWGVTPVLSASESGEYADKVDAAVADAVRAGLLTSGELIGVVAGITSGARATDTFRILTVP